MPALSHNLRALRGTQKQGDFAEVLGINQATYSRYESGSRSPSGKILCQMATRLNVDMQKLVGEISTAPPPPDSDGNARARGVRDPRAAYAPGAGDSAALPAPAPIDDLRADLAEVRAGLDTLAAEVRTLTRLFGAALGDSIDNHRERAG